MLKKSEWAQAFLNINQSAWRCPYCHAGVIVDQTNGFTCQNRHHFNLSKKGTMHLMKQAANNDYSRVLFEHRQLMMQSGLFDRVLTYIAQVMDLHVSKHLVVDIGCGEGTHLAKIQTMTQINSQQLVGIDIAKEAIVQASRTYGYRAFWCWADLTNLPFQSESCAVILNILSPSHYREFNRVLIPNGQLIKVIPNKDYLKELRQQVTTQSYSNEKVIERFFTEYPTGHAQRIQYEFLLTNVLYASLIEMTPLLWNLSKEQRQQLQQRTFPSVTVDVTVLVGQKNK